MAGTSRRWVTCLAWCGAVAIGGSSAVGAAPPGTADRLYILDCGRIDLTDAAAFSDTGDHDGEREAMPVPCFLIRHGATWMLWDLGLGDDIAATPAGREVVGLHFRVPRTLRSQLAALDLRPEDITLVGLSHLHADHSGNAPLFPHATFLVSPNELAYAGATPTPQGFVRAHVAAVRRARVDPVAGDRDVFGDGSVRMVTTPGHTVGHHSLMVRLPRAGWVILTGDVAHYQVNYDRDLVPVGNYDRANTIAAIDRVKGLAKTYRAKVVIQHAEGVYDQLPRFPAYLD